MVTLKWVTPRTKSQLYFIRIFVNPLQYFMTSVHGIDVMCNAQLVIHMEFCYLYNKEQDPEVELSNLTGKQVGR